MQQVPKAITELQTNSSDRYETNDLTLFTNVLPPTVTELASDGSGSDARGSNGPARAVAAYTVTSNTRNAALIVRIIPTGPRRMLVEN